MDRDDSLTTKFRRPETTNTSDYWYVTQEKWNELLREAAMPEKAKVALNNLRKYDTAGRIMETDEGADAEDPCSWCSRGSVTHPCRVYKSKPESCASCK